MPKVVIVGAGISGLALALQLDRRGWDVTVLERQTRPGGTMWTEYRDGFRVELGPNGFLDQQPATLRLCQELGLDNELISASESSRRNRYLYQGGRLRPLPHSLKTFLQTDLLSWKSKFQIFGERFHRGRPPTSDESVDQFVRRRVGDEVADVLADALVTGIHAGDPKLLSVRSAFPRLASWELQHGSIFRGMSASARQRRREAAEQGRPYRRGSRMWSLRGGLRVLAETIAQRLRRQPILGVSISRLECRNETPVWRAHGPGTESWPAEAVVLTCPAPEQAAILADLDPKLAESVAAIPYNRVAVVGLGFRASDVPVALDGFGFIAPQHTRRDILGAQWCSSIFPERAPAGMVLIRVLAGGWNRPEVVAWDDDRLLSSATSELRLAMGITAAPVFHHIVRWPRAIPQYHLGHGERVAAIRRCCEAWPGLFLGGNAYEGVALNDCTAQADLLATKIAAYLAARHA